MYFISSLSFSRPRMFATRLLRRAAIPIPLHAAATRTIKSILANSSTLENEQLTINAWVRTCRRSKTIAFASINDGSNLTGLQAVLPNGIDLGYAFSLLRPSIGTLMDAL